MSQQKLCLKWNNHTGNLLSVLQNFQKTDILVDVTLSCEGRNIKAHKMILSACSPYFRELFRENPCQHPIIIINGMKYDDIKSILDFMYRGEVNVCHDGLSSFLQAAEALKVKGLAEVCGEKQISNREPQDPQLSDPGPSRTESSNRRRHRGRKRSLSDSNRSDDDSSKKHKEPTSPEIHELSADEFDGGDMASNDGQMSNSMPRVPTSTYSSRSHQSEDEYEVEPSKLLEQTLTTDNVPMSNQSNTLVPSDNNLRIERIMGNSSEMESPIIQEPESPPDIKPFVQLEDNAMSSGLGTSVSDSMLYNEQSQPGPSNFQDGSLMQDNSQAQVRFKHPLKKMIRPVKCKSNTKPVKKILPRGCYECFHCTYSTNCKMEIANHLNYHSACREKANAEVPTKAKVVKKETTKKPEISKKLEVPKKQPQTTKVYKCVHCSFKTNCENQMTNHLKNYTNSIVYYCSKCNSKFEKESEFRAHFKADVHGEKYICDTCGLKFSMLPNLMCHRKSHKNDRVYVCETCNKRFTSIISFSQHKYIHSDELSAKKEQKDES